ncbi:UDP-N-acetylmuramoylalanyl-D-glutamyl-2, 6-diaminopimelate--D-alanyl-D-alanine ligase [Caenibius tardaugens NBRC 16725]|uniref:UDP-N-acetylmuramoyl-tripeptide--D-alanyl-D-alanine ligase n=1 Tax=Caenibius tardaugens NBRC 16725 TaxID=1219035 RepID=U2Y8C4_9SPHN|nr:UDP-N-acetylmuramoyl-tripeptide--D-alanyl-D-alanine ligase [Caenibius tardaugens]AZI36795.1 UDP-N-acetylmuramoyl-tripeptide--D-alanyl-D-alanine ligase [Caenibius tardaugens NBRC 16725]GAD49476.1 UDP-N-acetylmuramoylalanyl-D-glutamyl-2, 6-diaminopimelate--D-alanyl-D-alanine ligase [Caenibius tardaugens NBRC 16725]
MNAHRAILVWPDIVEDSAPRALWDAAAIARATGGVASGDFLCSGVEIDSRDVREGDLFFALKGETMDGHRFLDAAFANGASAAVVDRPIPQPHILVKDTNRALEALARASRERMQGKAIGVTGSVGKTGVKEAIFAALDRSSRGSAHRSVKSYNNHVGVPLSLARCPENASYGIFEMGMNHSGEIAALTAQVRPHVAVITTIAPAHIESLGSEEAIADAKAEVFAGLLPGGTAIIPADSAHFERLRDAALACGAKVISFGAAAHADVRLLDSVPASNGGSLVTADMGDTRICYTVAAAGEHWITNSLAVMAAVRAAGGDLGAAGLSLAEMPGLAGRGARHQIALGNGASALLIDESYNANPASMRATLKQLGETPARRRIAVLGAMKELGDFTPAFHAALAEPLAASGAEFALLVGPEMDALARELGKGVTGTLGKPIGFAHCANTEEAVAVLSGFGLEDGDAILVKGSNSVGLAGLVAHFSGKEG